MNVMNEVVKLLSKFSPEINGDPNVWLERPKELGGETWRQFLCGSCHGIYRCENKEFRILAVQNTKKNDNFDRVLEWFEKSAKRDKYKIAFLEVNNPKLREKLERLGWAGNETKMIKSF